MNARIYIEGGGDSKELHSRCREAFRRLLERCGFQGRMPRLVACGSREAAYRSFITAHLGSGADTYVAMWIDSESPVSDLERAWDHLMTHSGWPRPAGASDDQVIMMVTCMESWIVADHSTMKSFFGHGFRSSAMPAISTIESCLPQEIYAALTQATRGCSKRYQKGRVAFEVFGKLQPDQLKQGVSGFARSLRILADRL